MSEKRNGKGKGYCMEFGPEGGILPKPTGTIHVFRDKMKPGQGFRDELLNKLNARAIRALTSPPRRKVANG